MAYGDGFLPKGSGSGGGSGSGSGGGINTSAVLELIRDNANNMTIGDKFPSNPLEGALNMFRTDNITGLTWKDADETTDRTTPAYNGNIARYNGTDWYFFYNLRSLIEALARNSVPAGTADGGITIGATFPTGVSSGHVHLLTADNTSISFVNTSDEAVTAMAGDFTHYDGTKWVLVFRTKSIITAATAIGLTARNFGTSFPTSPKVGEVFILLQDIASGIAYKNNINDGASDVIRSAQRGQVFEYQEGQASLPDFWVLQGNINPPPIIPFEPQALSGSWTRFASSVIGNNSGVFYADSNELVIENNGNRARLLAIQPNHGIVFEDHGDDARTIFIVSAVDASDNRWVEYQGRWTSNREVATTVGNDVSIYHIPHSLNITPFIDVNQLGLRESSFGLTLPEFPRLNESFVFLAPTTTDPTWIDITGSPQGAALQGDVAQFVIFNNTPQWLYLGNIGGGGGGIDTSALEALKAELETQIAAVNNPISTHQLIASSKTTVDARYNQFVRVDVDWTLEDGIPDGIEALDDNLYISREYRGYISCETWQGNTLLGKKLLEVSDEQASEAVVQTIGSRGNMGRFNWLLLAVIHNGENVHQLSIQSESAQQAMFSGLQFRVYAEVAVGSAEIKRDLDLLGTRVGTAETEIDALESQVANIPVTSEVLWATSKALPANIPGNAIVDTDWTIGDQVTTGVAVDGDLIDIPEGLRGDIHIDIEDSSGNLLQRKVMPIAIGEVMFESPFGRRFRGDIRQDGSDDGILNFSLRTTSGGQVSITGGSIVKIYGVSALPRNQVSGITQQQLDAALAALDILYIDPNRRYATLADLRKNWVFFFSHVPERYKTANVVSISWDGVIAYKDAWTPSTEYIFFAINPTQLQNLDDVVTQDTSKLLWRVQVTFLQGTTTLGIETVPIIIDRG